MKIGNERELNRSLGLVSAIVLTVSSIIGSGIYKKVAPMSAELYSTQWVIVCWIVAGIITLCGALSTAEIAGMLAGSGGEYVYFKKIYNRFIAFLFGWTCFTVIRSAAIASIAYVFAQSFNALFPLPELAASWSHLSLAGVFFPFDNFSVKILTVVVILFLSTLNYAGIKYGDGLNKISLVLVLLSMVIIIFAGLSSSIGSLSNIFKEEQHPVEGTTFGFAGYFFSALLAAFWAYEGWSNTGYIGGEIKDANRNVPRALVGGVLFIIIVYGLLNFTYLYVVPIDEMIMAHQSQNSIAAILVVSKIFGPLGESFIAALILVTTFGCTNANILGPPRLYYAMAKESLFFKSAARVHPKFNTPSGAILWQAGWSVTLVFSGSFDQLTDMLVFAAFMFYGATALGVFILRYKMPDTPRPYKTWGYPVVPVIFVIFCATLTIVTCIVKPREALIGLSLICSGIPFYWFWTKKKGP
jgi:basic amino acid/polyamine antiporter, APA family